MHPSPQAAQRGAASLGARSTVLFIAATLCPSVGISGSWGLSAPCAVLAAERRVWVLPADWCAPAYLLASGWAEAASDAIVGPVLSEATSFRLGAPSPIAVW